MTGRVFISEGGTSLIWIIPAAVAALSFFKLGSLYVWVQVMSMIIKALAAACMLLLTCAAGAVLWRTRRRRPQ